MLRATSQHKLASSDGKFSSNFSVRWATIEIRKASVYTRPTTNGMFVFPSPAGWRAAASKSHEGGREGDSKHWVIKLGLRNARPVPKPTKLAQ